jgi:hypothetical protein
MPAILAMRKDEFRRMMVPGWYRQKVNKTPSQQKKVGCGGVRLLFQQ